MTNKKAETIKNLAAEFADACEKSGVIIDWDSYIKSGVKVRMVCPVHGEKFRLVGDIRKAIKRGSPVCQACGNKAAADKTGAKRRKGADKSRKEFEEVYKGNPVVIDWDSFTTTREPVDFVCPEHGAKSRVYNDMRKSFIVGGHACPDCGNTARNRAYVSMHALRPIDDVKAEFESWFEGSPPVTVDWDNYTDTKAPLEIFCPIHKEQETSMFRMRLAMGRGGHVCPSCGEAIRATACAEANPETRSDNDAIYMWRAQGEWFNGKPVYKIGITSWRLGKARIHQVAKASGFAPVVFFLRKMEGGKATEIENMLHEMGERPGYGGFDGSTEFRALTTEEVQTARDLVDFVAA